MITTRKKQGKKIRSWRQGCGSRIKIVYGFFPKGQIMPLKMNLSFRQILQKKDGLTGKRKRVYNM